MRLNRNDFVFNYAPGKTRIPTDSLSCVYLPGEQRSTAGAHITQVHAFQNVSDVRLEKVRKAMSGSTETKGLLKAV